MTSREPTGQAISDGGWMDAAIEAAAAAEYEHMAVRRWANADREERDEWLDDARVAVAAALPHIQAAVYRDAAEEVHREALWQYESANRGMFANGETSIDRLLMLEQIFRDAAARVARGGPTE